MTVREMSLRMTERELGRWRAYSRQRGFPSERLQMQAALGAYIAAKVGGGAQDVTLEDFLIRFHRPEQPKPPPVDARLGAEVMSSLAGVKVRRLGQRKKE